MSRIGFRHSDPRFGFMWQTTAQPPARWHGNGEGPANYFADTPVGAWAEFVRHEGITDVADLAGVKRSLWAVELPDGGYEAPALPIDVLTGGIDSYKACQDEARRLRGGGATRLHASGAALIAGGAQGWFATDTGVTPAAPARDGLVWVLFGVQQLRGWIAVDGGSPPPAVLPFVRTM